MNIVIETIAPYRPYILVSFVTLILLEATWSWWRKKGLYNGRETAANVALVVGVQLTKLLFLGWQLMILGLAYKFAPVKWAQTPWSFLAGFLLVDFFYYWYHRSMHEFKPLWALHYVHHSSPWMNLTTSFRLHLLSPLVGPFFYMPVALLGIHPNQILIVFFVNLLYQFWLHTQVIGKLGFLEGVINTPSGHRVHHGSNERYLDKNYGGFLMIWDRLFGTYEKETEPVVYGTTTGFAGHNPLRHLFGSFWDLARGRMTYRG